MKIFVHANRLNISAERRLALVGELHSALERLGHRLIRASVFLRHETGRKGGVDTSCRVVLRRRQHPSLIVAERDADAGSLAARVAARIEKAVRRRMDKARACKGAISMSGQSSFS